MRISNYSFGKITIDGKTYTSDVIVYSDKIDHTWRRKEGHTLSLEDIPGVIKEKPEVVIIGCGANSCLRVSKKTEEELLRQGIKLLVLPTDKAVDEYNKLFSRKKNVIACLHLTC